MTAEDGTTVKYYWYAEPISTHRDTVPVYYVNLTDSLCTVTVHCVAFAEGYNPSSTSHTITIVNSDRKKGSIKGLDFDQSKDFSFTDPRDGREYWCTTVKGTDWFKENLAYRGAGVPLENCESTSDVFGRFYTWDEAVKACPEGWRMSSLGDWSDAASVILGENPDPKDRFLSILPGCKALVISGTKAPGFSADIYPWMVKKAKENGLIAVIDVKKQELINCLEHHPDIIKPNLSEFVETFFDDVRITENEDSESLKPRVMEKAKELYRDYGVKTILSRGRFDTWAFDGKEFITVPSINVPVVNTIGCGDSMTAGLVDALLDGRPFAESIRFGMQCAVQRASHLYHGL